MSQKFILLVQKTAKKAPLFEDEKAKKFTRKRPDRERSFDSKRSKEDSVFSQYIKQPKPVTNIKISLLNDQSFTFTDQLNLSAIQANQGERKHRKTMIVRTNNNRQPSREQCTLTLRIKILETQLKAKQGQCQRYKLQLDEQKQRRRKAQFDRKASMKEIMAYDKQNQELLTNIKKLNKQKQILNKQIEFLQKINYDQKARNILSFREKHMQEQIQKLKEKLQSKKIPSQIKFQQQLEEIKFLKENAQEKFRALKSVIIVQKNYIKRLKDMLIKDQQITTEKIIRSQEYCLLREKCKKFIEQYKEVRMQNNNLRALIETRQAQLVLSDSQTQSH